MVNYKDTNFIFLKNYMMDFYFKEVIFFDLIFKFNVNVKVFFFLFFKFVYMNYNRIIKMVRLSRLYKILRENYNQSVINIKFERKPYLKGRVMYDKLTFYSYILFDDFLMSFNYLCFYIYRISFSYNPLFLLSSSFVNKNKSLILYWNDFNTRFKQLNEAILNKKNSFFKVSLFRITLSLVFISNFVFEGDKTLFVFNFLSFFGFHIPLRRIKMFSFFIRII